MVSGGSLNYGPNSDSQSAKSGCVEGVPAVLSRILAESEGRRGPIEANSLRFARIGTCGWVVIQSNSIQPMLQDLL